VLPSVHSLSVRVQSQPNARVVLISTIARVIFELLLVLESSPSSYQIGFHTKRFLTLEDCCRWKYDSVYYQSTSSPSSSMMGRKRLMETFLPTFL